MGGGNEMARNLLTQEPGRENRHANAAGAPKVAETEGKRHKGAGHYIVNPEGGDAFTVFAIGRDAWALDRLRLAGVKGCTPINEPAPRWSAYVHRLRERGVPIETLHELHGGDFAGTHARYVLRATVLKGGAI